MLGEPGFGAELRRRRETAGISLTELGVRVHYSKGHLSKIESGQKAPTVQLARLCDAAVGAEGELLRLVADGVVTGAPVRELDAVERDGWTLGVTPGGAGFFVPGGEQVPKETEFGMTFGERATYSGDVTTLAGMFWSRFETARRLGQVAGPAVVLPGVIADTQTLRGVAGNASPEDRPVLWRLAARYAEFAGWMTQEAGDDRMALWWTETAVRMAVLGGDHSLSTYALVRQADVALHAADALTTISLARQAQLDERIPARIRGLAAQREAQGHALAGDHAACRRALDVSAELLGAAEARDGTPELGTTHTPDMSVLVGGWCLYDLGLPAEAAEVLDRGVTRFAPDAHRSRARYVTRAALAYGTAGELDRACELMTSVLDHLHLIDSATIRHDLRQLTQVLARRQNHAVAREVRQRLVTVLRTPGGAPAR